MLLESKPLTKDTKESIVLTIHMYWTLKFKFNDNQQN